MSFVVFAPQKRVLQAVAIVMKDNSQTVKAKLNSSIKRDASMICFQLNSKRKIVAKKISFEPDLNQ
jgi:hypothetical protein